VRDPAVAPALFCVELRTQRWEEALEWYRHRLGLRVLIRSSEDGYALLACGSARLALLRRSHLGPVSDRTSLVLEVVDLDGARRRLAAAKPGLPLPIEDPEGYRRLDLTDPDGNRIRLIAWPVSPG
jgi:catechol 2,3-dioxygenase-like lactoylglutathione lyase family enzyme